MKRQPPRIEGKHYIYRSNGTKAPTFESWSQHFAGIYIDVPLEMHDDGRIRCRKRRSEAGQSGVGGLDEPSGE